MSSGAIGDGDDVGENTANKDEDNASPDEGSASRVNIVKFRVGEGNTDEDDCLDRRYRRALMPVALMSAKAAPASMMPLNMLTTARLVNLGPSIHIGLND